MQILEQLDPRDAVSWSRTARRVSFVLKLFCSHEFAHARAKCRIGLFYHAGHQCLAVERCKPYLLAEPRRKTITSGEVEGPRWPLSGLTQCIDSINEEFPKSVSHSHPAVLRCPICGVKCPILAPPFSFENSIVSAKMMKLNNIIVLKGLFTL